MTALRLLILSMTLVMVLATLWAMIHHGPDFYTPFVMGLVPMDWQSHVNLDFALYLVLSGLWLAWRSGFTAAGIVTGVLAANLGMVVLGPVVLVLIARAGGDPAQLLLGVHAPRQGTISSSGS